MGICLGQTLLTLSTISYGPTPQPLLTLRQSLLLPPGTPNSSLALAQLYFVNKGKGCLFKSGEKGTPQAGASASHCVSRLGESWA